MLEFCQLIIEVYFNVRIVIQEIKWLVPRIGIGGNIVVNLFTTGAVYNHRVIKKSTVVIDPQGG